MHLALYRGQRSQNKSALPFDWLICWWTRGPFSHAELLWHFDPATSRAYCASSSIRDKGVRYKYMYLHPEKWVVVPITGDLDRMRAARAWFEQQHGKPYDWLGIFGFVLHRRWGRGEKWYCSESVACALGLPETRITPNELARLHGVTW